MPQWIKLTLMFNPSVYTSTTIKIIIIVVIHKFSNLLLQKIRFKLRFQQYIVSDVNQQWNLQKYSALILKWSSS